MRRVVALAVLMLASASCNGPVERPASVTSIDRFVAHPTSVQSGDSVSLSWKVESAGQHPDPDTFSCSLARRFEGMPAEDPFEVACEGEHVDVPRPPDGSTYVRYQLNALRHPPDTVSPYVTAGATVSFGGASSTRPMIAIAAGYAHSLALHEDGSVWAWGSNLHGQLGRGDDADSRTPVTVTGLDDVTALAAGRYHSLALRDDGTVWAWGSNWTGQLGDGTTTSRLAPVEVTGLSGVAAIAAGANHSLALRTDGTVWAWGENFRYAQLGDGTTNDRYAPVQVLGIDDATAITAGTNHSLAALDNGTVLAWGHNADGQLGDGTTTQRTTAVAVLGHSDVSGVAAGRDHSVAVRDDGTVFAWGRNADGQVGDGTTTDRLTPVQVATFSGSGAAVAAAGLHSLSLTPDGAIWAWGSNAFGQVGDGTTDDRATPVQVDGAGASAAIAAGTEHSVALRTDGTVWTWGRNWLGQLGDGTIVDRPAPVRVTWP